MHGSKLRSALEHYVRKEHHSVPIDKGWTDRLSYDGFHPKREAHINQNTWKVMCLFRMYAERHYQIHLASIEKGLWFVTDYEVRALADVFHVRIENLYSDE